MTATTRLSACARRPRRAPRRWCAATPTAAPCRDRSPRPCATSRRGWPATPGSGIHCHDDAGCGVANTLAGVEAGRDPRPGHAQRLRRALREREPRLDHPEPPAQARLPLPRRRPARAAHRGRPLRRRAAQLHPRPRPAVRGAQRLRAQGRHARRRRQRRPGDVRARRPGAGRQRARAAHLRAVGQGDGASPRRGGRPRARRRRRARAWSTASRSSSTDGYHFEAADGSFELLLRKETGEYEPLFRLESWRAIVEKRADGKVETEATIKIWVDGERYVRTAEGNGPVNALDKALRAAISEIYPHLEDIDLVNFKVRILDEGKGTGAVTRVLLDASDGHRRVGLDRRVENIIEASWEALVDSLERGMQPRRPAAAHGRGAPRRDGVDATAIPLARPVLGPARGGAAVSTSCARAGSRSARGSPSSRRRSPRGSASRTPARSPAAPRACTSRCAPPA